MTDQILISGLKVDAVIGHFAWEKKLPRPLIFDLVLHTDLSIAGKSDDLKDTVDYDAVCARVQEITENSDLALLETLAEQICAALLSEFSISTVELTLHKPGAVPGAQGIAIKIAR